MNLNRSPGRWFQRLTPALSAPAFKPGAAVGCGVGCGAGEAGNSPLLSQRGREGVKRRERDGERWGCGSGGHVPDGEQVKVCSRTEEEVLSLVLGGGIVAPVTERSFASLRCPPIIPIYSGIIYSHYYEEKYFHIYYEESYIHIYYGELHTHIIMEKNIFPYIRSGLSTPLPNLLTPQESGSRRQRHTQTII